MSTNVNLEHYVLRMLAVKTQKVVMSVAVSQDTQEMDTYTAQVCFMKMSIMHFACMNKSYFHSQMLCSSKCACMYT